MAEACHLGMSLLQHEDSALVHRRAHPDNPKHLRKSLWTCTGHSKWGQELTVNPPLKVKVAQSCPALCDPMDYTVHGILQARILEQVAFPFSRGSSQPRDWTQFSHMAGRFFTSWAAREAEIHPRSDTIPEWSLHSKVTCPWNQYLKMAGHSRLPPSVGPM